jgi:hypothetical protein
MVSLGRQNGPSHHIDLVRCDVTEHVREPGKRIRVPVIHAETPAGGDVVANHLAGLDDGYEPQILGKISTSFEEESRRPS